MTLIHVQSWDWTPLHQLISAWKQYRHTDPEPVHMHRCPRCWHYTICRGIDCTITQRVGKVSYGNPEQCRQCRRGK